MGQTLYESVSGSHLQMPSSPTLPFFSETQCSPSSQRVANCGDRLPLHFSPTFFSISGMGSHLLPNPSSYRQTHISGQHVSSFFMDPPMYPSLDGLQSSGNFCSMHMAMGQTLYESVSGSHLQMPPPPTIPFFSETQCSPSSQRVANSGGRLPLHFSPSCTF